MPLAFRRRPVPVDATIKPAARRPRSTRSIRAMAAGAAVLALGPAIYAFASNGSTTTSNVVARINAGGPAYTDSAGNVWSADTGAIGGLTYTNTATVTGTADPTLYNTEHYAMTGWTIPVPSNGIYTVKLFEAETWWTQPGQRVFSVTAEGQPFATNVDLAKQLGTNTAGVISGNVTVTDGVLNLGFSATADTAKVNAIEVDSVSPPPTTTAVARINAGGPAYTDSSGNVWSADTGATGGLSYANHAPAVTGTNDPELYRTEHYAMTGYSIPVPSNGVYTVRLLESETYWTRPGQRIFSVTAEGQPFATNVDLAAQFGVGVAGVLSGNVTVTDGVLNLGFTATADTAKVDAIEVDAATGATTSNVVVTRIRAGGPAFTDSTGTTWAADTDYIGGITYTAPGAVTGATSNDSALYDTERYAMTGYDIPVPAAGTYIVRLLESENLWKHTGQRIFSVTAEGQPLATNVDLFGAVGYRHVDTLTGTVQVTDGVLSLRFSATRDTAKVSGIEVYQVVTSGSVATPTTAPTTAAPTTVAPTTAAPTTAAPTTAAPTTVAPTTAAPTTVAPTTAPPTTTAPSNTAGLRTSVSQIGGGLMPAGQIPTPNITVSPSTNFATLATSANQVIGFQPGTYTGLGFTPKNGQTYVGLAPGVILDGNFSTAVAFGSSADNVTIENMTIQRYSAGEPSGYRLAPGAFGVPTFGGTIPNAAINPDWGGSAGANPHPATPSSNWTLNYVSVLYNRAAGVKMVDGSQVLNSRLDDNGVEGYISSSVNALVDNDEIAWNNTPASFAVTGNTTSDVGNEAGGGKITGGAGNVVTHSEFHHNGGNAIWDDAYATVTDTFNYVHDNTRNGIMHEIGFDGTITDNVITNNGRTITTPNGTQTGVTGGSTFDQGAGIYWSDSRGTGSSTVTRNTITNNLNGIMLISANRWPYLSNVAISNNTVSSSGHSGWYQAGSTQPVTGVSFNGDSYVSGGGWAWAGSNALNFSGFQAKGQDVTGSSN